MGKFDISRFAAQAPVPTLPDLPQDGPRTIKTITGEIVQLQRVGGEAVLGIGQRLIEAKAMLSHGEWGAWLAEHVNYSERSAQRLMRLAREWSNPTALSDLGAAKALALLTLPPDDREAFLSEPHVVDGEEKRVVDMTSRQLQAALADREAALAGKTAAEEARAKMAKDVKLLKALNADVSARCDAQARALKELRAELKAEREKPVPVAVMSVDEEALAEARAEGAAAAREDAAAQRRSLEAELAGLRARVAAAQPRADDEPAASRDEADFMSILSRTQEDVNRMLGLYLKALGRDENLAARFARQLYELAETIAGVLEEEI